LDDTSFAAMAATPGVTVAVAMDRGGFVIEAAGATTLYAEDVAGLASCLLESTEEIVRELGRGALRNMICEFEDGLLLVMGSDDSATRLAVVLHDPAALEAVRQSARQIMTASPHVR
jgi:predicted regulator of Ras-like GTPase activity (Roadblock/LC7/MglB family)